MKRLVLLIVFLLISAFFVFNMPLIPIGPHLLSLVPRESFCVLEMQHPEELGSYLAGTPLARSMILKNWLQPADSNSHPTRRDNKNKKNKGRGIQAGTASSLHTKEKGKEQEPPDSLANLIQLFSLAATIRHEPDSLVLDTAVFALVPLKAGPKKTTPATGTPLLLGRLRDRHGFHRLISYLARSANMSPVQQDQINGHPVVHYQVQGHDLYLGNYQDVLLLSPVKAVLHQAISLANADTADHSLCIFGNDFFVRGRGMHGTINLQPARQSDQDGTTRNVLTAYVNVQALAQLASPPSQWLGLSALLTPLAGKGIDKCMVNWSQNSSLHHISSLFHLQKGDLSPLLRLCSLRVPVRNQEIDHVPAGITTYFWSNWFSPASWWQYYLALSKNKAEKRRQTVNKVLRKYLHLSMAELTAQFEYDWSVFVTEIKQSAFVPVPRLCFRLGMLDPHRLAQVLQKNIATLPHRLDIVASTKVTSLVMAGGLMEPSYSFINNNLWLFDGYDQVKQFVQPGATRLVEEAEFQHVAGKTDDPVNLQLFVRMPPLIKGLRDLFAWLAESLPASNSSGRQKRFMVKQVMEPLFDTLSGIESAFVSARMQPDELETHVRLQADGEKSESGDE